MFNKLYDWYHNYTHKHPLVCHLTATALGTSLIWSGGYAAALHDYWWVTAGNILGILIGLELIHAGINYLDDSYF